jgi:hypothetical protein
VKLVPLLGFIIKKFVTMHGHMNVRKKEFNYIRGCHFFCKMILKTIKFFLPLFVVLKLEQFTFFFSSCVTFGCKILIQFLYLQANMVTACS